MLKDWFNQNRIYCFSPTVMLTTFVIEGLMAIYILFRYKANTITKIIVTMLSLLATFQLAEYIVCKEISIVWSRIGYVAITMLPPLGLHLVYEISKRPSKNVVKATYLLGWSVALAFAFVPNSINEAVCQGNYAIFIIKQPYSIFYGWYYLGLLLLTVYYANRKNDSPQIKRSLNWITYGYLAFILPAALLVYILPETKLGIPSIMCGFAIILAFILSFKIVHENAGVKLSKHTNKFRYHNKP
jgi:hypothetical protein